MTLAVKIWRPDAHIVAANADLVIRGHAPGKDHSEPELASTAGSVWQQEQCRVEHFGQSKGLRHAAAPSRQGHMLMLPRRRSW